MNKPWSPAKDLKEKSSGEVTSLTASIAAETAGLALDVISSRLDFEPRTSQIIQRAHREDIDLTFDPLLPCQQKDTKQVSGWPTQETNMAGDNRGLCTCFNFFNLYQLIFYDSFKIIQATYARSFPLYLRGWSFTVSYVSLGLLQACPYLYEWLISFEFIFSCYHLYSNRPVS